MLTIIVILLVIIACAQAPDLMRGIGVGILWLGNTLFWMLTAFVVVIGLVAVTN